MASSTPHDILFVHVCLPSVHSLNTPRRFSFILSSASIEAEPTALVGCPCAQVRESGEVGANNGSYLGPGAHIQSRDARAACDRRRSPSPSKRACLLVPAKVVGGFHGPADHGIDRGALLRHHGPTVQRFPEQGDRVLGTAEHCAGPAACPKHGVFRVGSGTRHSAGETAPLERLSCMACVPESDVSFCRRGCHTLV